MFGGPDVDVLPSRQPHHHLGPGSAVLRGASTIELIVHLSSFTVRCHRSYDVQSSSSFASSTSKSGSRGKGDDGADANTAEGCRGHRGGKGRGRGDAATAEMEEEPLITIHATTTKTVALREVRAGDASDADDDGYYDASSIVDDDEGDDDDPSSLLDAGGSGGGAGISGRCLLKKETTEKAKAKAKARARAKADPTLLVLRERTVEFTGERILSIQPASYERVHVLYTPSFKKNGRE